MKFKLIVLFALFLASCIQQNQKEGVNIENDILFIREVFSEDGVLEFKESFKKISTDSFIEHGFYEAYYPSGQKKYFANIHRGYKIGTVYRFFENGEINEVWFYNPVGKAIYALKYDSLGNLTEEIAREQRHPQIVMKDINSTLVEVKVYSVNIPDRKKSVYLSTPDEILDSIQHTTTAFDIFTVSRDTVLYEIAVDYYESSSGEFIETDFNYFRLDDFK